MDSKTSTGRASKGSVTVLVSHGRLQLRFSFGGKRHYISTGYPDTPHHRKLAEIKAAELEKDILYERFDPSNLSKYKPQAKPQAIAPSAPSNKKSKKSQFPSLDILWRNYTDFKRPSLSSSTIVKDFTKVRNCIRALPTRSLKDAVSIRDWLLANKTPNATKRILTQLSACCDWAMKSQMIPHNPFLGIAADIKVPKSSAEDMDINPFSPQERDQIIQAFRDDQHYRTHLRSFGTGGKLLSPVIMVYSSSLTDQEWEILGPLLPQILPSRKQTCPPNWTKRVILDGIFYQLKNGCNWQDRPNDLPPYSIVYWHYKQWRAAGAMERLMTVLHEPVRTQVKKSPSGRG